MNSAGMDDSSDSSDEADELLFPSTDPAADEFEEPRRKRRKTGRDAKENAALGVFGSESEDDGPGRRWKSKALRGKGVGFVRSGARTTQEDEDEEDEDDNKEERDRDTVWWCREEAASIAGSSALMEAREAGSVLLG